MKYILTTGCSFTNNLRLDPDNLNQDDENRRSWPYYLQQELGNEYQVLNYGGATNDNISMCRIQLYHIDRLIKEGVNPKDISIITQWSDPNRYSVYIDEILPKEFQRKLGHTLVYHNDWETKKGVFFLTGGFSPPDDEESAIHYFGIKNAIHYWELDINFHNQINQTLHWLEVWNLLESRCKELGIKTYYMSMRNIYSKEAEKWGGAPENKSDIPTKTIWFEDYEVLKPYIEKLPINSPNYWHYKNYNGLLEWSIDNRNDKEFPLFQEYLGDEVDNYEDYLKVQSNGWGHPSAQMMQKFVKDELLNLIGYEKLSN
jgi:hypothetical protein